jgi:Ca2+:H+ antiporter
MKLVIDFFRNRPTQLLLFALPLAILAEYLHWGDLMVFIFSAAGIIPLASLIGEATESLTVYTGPRLGGLLNATLGNAAELIITIVAIREGLLELVKASITGSILGNILLVMGLSFLLGGFKHGIQRFDSRHASRSAILLLLAVMALLIPSMWSSAIGPETSLRVEGLSLGVAAIMIILYVAGLIFTFTNQTTAVTGPVAPEYGETKQEKHQGKSEKKGAEVYQAAKTGHGSGHGGGQSAHGGHVPWTLRTSLIMLGLSTLGVVVMSEVLVGVIEPVVASLGVSEFFLGIILIPLIGNVAEHLVAVKVAMQNQMDLSVEIAVASSLQIALFVAPVLVFISLILGDSNHWLHLDFNQFELLAMVVSVLVTVQVCQDGESNWLEGAELLAVYLILALAFFLLPV